MFDMYIGMYNATHDYYETMNLVPGFFQLTTKALLENSALRLCRIYDKDEKPLTIFKLIRTLQSDPEANKSYHEEIEGIVAFHNEKVTTLQPMIEKLHDLRDSSLAHNDRKYCFVDPFKSVGLTIAEYHLIISTAGEIINLVRTTLCKSHIVFDSCDKSDVSIMIKALDRFLHEHPDYSCEADQIRTDYMKSVAKKYYKNATNQGNQD